jgi:RND family efflux transporter MFP subunit
VGAVTRRGGTTWRIQAAVLAAALSAGCRGGAADTSTDSAPVGVAVQRARIETIRDVASASGIVVPSAAGNWTVFAPDAARIAALPRKEGDVVAVGDVLVQFDIPSLTQELSARQIAVIEAQGRADRAKADFTRVAGLFERGIASRNAYEAARAEQTTSESMLSQAITQLEVIKLDEVRSIVRARFPGTVVRVWHAQGDLVSGSESDPILQVIDPMRLQVAVQLPTGQLARIVPGQSATVLAIGEPKPVGATVASKATATDPNAPTGEVRLAFNELSTLPLNAPLSVEILLAQRASVTVVPAEALMKDEASSYVVVAGDDGRAHRRDVRTGLQTATLVEIVAGLTAGERVVVGGLQDVSEGTPIAFTE